MVMTDLEKRWLSDSSVHFFKSEDKPITFDPQEESWLDDHPASAAYFYPDGEPLAEGELPGLDGQRQGHVPGAREAHLSGR